MEANEIPSSVIPGSRGFVFATTGEAYTILARRAARTMREVMPGALIDLFTDQPLEDSVFDRIHPLDHGWFRPKMQAIRESRFERTVVMDADMVVVADISEVFDVLDHCDIAGVEGRNRTREMIPDDTLVPRCVPPINSGFLAVRASEKLHVFARAWEDEVRESESRIDQPSFRRLLYQSGLRFFPLGKEYNLIWIDMLDFWPKMNGAPRVLHVRELHMRPPGDPETAISLGEAIGEQRAQHVVNLCASDWSLGGDPDAKVLPPFNLARKRKRKRATNRQPGKPASVPAAASGFADRIRRALGRQAAKAEPKPPQRHNGRKSASKNRPYSPYWAAVLGLATFNPQLRICIVGANDGKFGDPLYELIRRHLAESTDVILVEPQPYLIPYLAENYAFHPSHEIVNAAVGPADELLLHAVRPEAWESLTPGYAREWPTYRASTGVTSSERQLVLDWVEKHAPDGTDIEALVAELRVPCWRLPAMLASAGRPAQIDVLQVDAEGFDDEAIYASDIDQTRPAIIYFEDTHLSADRRKRLRQYLSDSYRLVSVGRDVMAVRRAG